MGKAYEISQSAIITTHNDLIQGGICGWLSPDGQFIDVVYGKHDEVAQNLEKNWQVTPVFDRNLGCRAAHGERLLELSGYIKFTCRLVGNKIVDAYVFFPQQFGYERDVTSSQINWLEENFHRMSQYQQQYVQDYLYYTYGIALWDIYT